MLGTCYLKGWGTSIDYEAARNEFLVYPAEELSAIGLGEIYCFGLGVKQNIRTGMEYLDKFPNNPTLNYFCYLFIYHILIYVFHHDYNVGIGFHLSFFLFLWSN